MAFDKSLPILLVDDYRTMLRIIRNLLRQLDFTSIDEATDGCMALAKLKDRRYGLVIAECGMQPMTGLDLLRAVRADGTLATVPFIMITAERGAASVVAAKRAGIDDYVLKPFNAESLRAKIDVVMGR